MKLLFCGGMSFTPGIAQNSPRNVFYFINKKRYILLSQVMVI